MLKLIIDLVLTYISTVAFGIILNIPRRALNTSGWIGLLSFLAYKLYLMAGGGIVGGNFLGALLIGILSMQAARWLKMPVINFNIPSLVPFVPGGQAYQMVKNFALGNSGVALQYLLEVAEIAGAIAFGFLLAELVNRLQARIMVRFSSKWRHERHRNPKL